MIIFRQFIYVVSLLILLNCGGGGEGSASAEEVIIENKTLQGRSDGLGLDLVILGDGFTSDDMASYHQLAQEFSNYVLNYNATLVKQSSAWNIHRIDTISVTSDLTSNSETAFGAYYNCNNIRRLICVDTTKVLEVASAAFPQFDQLVVIVNDGEYGGSGGSIAVFSRNNLSKEIGLHELGHSIAQLGDEYETAGYPAPTTEPIAANLTINNDITTVKWAHWTDKPDVSIFEGGGYTEIGVWRPTVTSIMRENGQPFYSVNQEAWSLAIYSKSGTFFSKTPSESLVSHQANSDIDFSIELSMGEDSQNVEWFVDDVSVSNSSTSFTCCKDKISDYIVKAVITDITGSIRQDNDGLAISELSWNVSVN